MSTIKTELQTWKTEFDRQCVGRYGLTIKDAGLDEGAYTSYFLEAKLLGKSMKDVLDAVGDKHDWDENEDWEWDGEAEAEPPKPKEVSNGIDGRRREQEEMEARILE